MTPEEAAAKARTVIDQTPTPRVREYARKFGVRVKSLSIAKLREAVIEDFTKQILKADLEKKEAPSIGGEAGLDEAGKE